MKKVLLFVALCAIAALPFQQTKATKGTGVFRYFSIGLNVYNGTTDNGSIYLYGPTPVSAYLSPGASSYGPLTAGTYTINMYTAASGTRTFRFNDSSIVTSAGWATFNNVPITYTSFAYIY